MRTNPQNVRYEKLAGICDRYFGKPRQNGTSHAVYAAPWKGDPRVIIQEGKNGKAKTYQVCQVVDAVDKLLKEDDEQSAKANQSEDKGAKSDEKR